MSTELADARAPKLRRALTITAIGAVLAATAVVISAPAQAIGPTTIRVDTGGINAPTCGGATQQCLTIQYAIDKANSGDTVQVAGGTYNEVLTITKGVNLQGAGTGAGGTIIDGTGMESGPDGLVNIGTTDGDVTISNFTIQNPVEGPVFGPHSISVLDPTAADHITISHNKILGWATSPSLANDAQIGIDSANTFAATTITHNDISGVWQGVLLEGNRGALDVSNNHIHDLTTYVDGDTKYPAEGVYVLSDKQSSASNQNVTNNLFDNFNGIGIAFSAGYDLTGCSETICTGSVTGSVSDNTFALSANEPGFTSASAIRLRATHEGDVLNLTMGGNTGTVVAPTKTIEESPGDGSILVTPSSPPNTIVTVPPPTLAVATPATVTTGEAPVAFALASHNGSGDNFPHARFQITFTGDPGLTAAQVHLQSRVGTSVFQDVALSGATSTPGGITGFVEPASGFDYLTGADAPNDFRLSFALDAPGGSLTSTVRLVEVSQGSGNPVLNTLATDADTITVVANHAPTAADQTLSVKHDHDLAIVLASTEADGDTPLVFTHGSPDVGTLTDTDSQHLTYTPPALYVGPDSFSYTVTDSVGAETTGTVHITVTNAAPSAPNKSVTTTAGHPVAVTLNGTDTDGDSLTYDNSNPSRGTLSGTAPNLTYTPNGFYVGADTFTYTTNDGIDSSTVGTVSIRVNKVVSTTTMVVTQNVPGAAPRLRIKATVTAPGAHIDTALVTIKDGTTTIGSARLVNGQINVLFTNIKKGVHTLYVYFPGSLSATASSASYHLRVFG